MRYLVEICDKLIIDADGTQHPLVFESTSRDAKKHAREYGASRVIVHNKHGEAISGVKWSEETQDYFYVTVDEGDKFIPLWDGWSKEVKKWKSI